MGRESVAGGTQRAQLTVRGHALDLIAPSLKQLYLLVRQLASLDHLESNYHKLGVGPFQHIVDVGACIGMFSIAHRLVYPDAKIIAFEPYPLNWKFLERNCVGLAVDARWHGLHNNSDMFLAHMSMPHGETDSGRASMYDNSFYLETLARFRTLDDSIDMGRIDLLKIDVEGNEINVLRGGAETIRRERPVLIVEGVEEQQARAGHSNAELQQVLTDMGYRLAATLEGDGIFLPV